MSSEGPPGTGVQRRAITIDLHIELMFIYSIYNNRTFACNPVLI